MDQNCYAAHEASKLTNYPHLDVSINYVFWGLISEEGS